MLKTHRDDARHLETTPVLILSALPRSAIFEIHWPRHGECDCDSWLRRWLALVAEKPALGARPIADPGVCSPDCIAYDLFCFCFALYLKKGMKKTQRMTCIARSVPWRPRHPHSRRKTRRCATRLMRCSAPWEQGRLGKCAYAPLCFVLSFTFQTSVLANPKEVEDLKTQLSELKERLLV